MVAEVCPRVAEPDDSERRNPRRAKHARARGAHFRGDAYPVSGGLNKCSTR